MRIHDYSTAALMLLDEGVSFDEVLRKLTTYLKTRGHEKLLPSVLRTLKDTLEHRTEKYTPTITLATKESAERYQDDIRAALRALSTEEHTAVTASDPTIIGGYVITAGTVEVDASYKTKLLNIYRSLTSA